MNPEEQGGETTVGKGWEENEDEKNWHLEDLTAKTAKTTNSTTITNKSNSLKFPTELDKLSGGKDKGKVNLEQQQHQSSEDPYNQQQQQYQQHQPHHHEPHPHHIYEDFTGSMKDELSVAAIGTGNSERALQANMLVVF